MSEMSEKPQAVNDAGELVPVAGSIVTFNPDIALLRDNVESVRGQVARLYIIDNASSNREEIRSLLDSIRFADSAEDVQQNSTAPIDLIENAANLGIAKALNQACEHAVSDGFSWLLTLDQDTVVPKNLVGLYRGHLDAANAGILCARVYDRRLDIVYGEADSDGIIEADGCITSGSLMSLHVWRELDGFDEKLFIDGVDHEYNDRLFARGYAVYQVNAAVIEHSIGQSSFHTFLFKKVMTIEYPAFRRYYIARNAIYVARKEGRPIRMPLWRVSKMILAVILYESGKIDKIKAAIRGVRDGWKMDIEK